MVNLTEQYVFTRPFTKDDPTNRCSDKVKERIHLVYEDQTVLSAAARMKQLFLTKKECLCHGDLHTSSIMVDSSSAKVKHYYHSKFHISLLFCIPTSRFFYKCQGEKPCEKYILALSGDTFTILSETATNMSEFMLMLGTVIWLNLPLQECRYFCSRNILNWMQCGIRIRWNFKYCTILYKSIGQVLFTKGRSL